MVIIFSKSGKLCSLSHFETACRDTPILPASSSCEIPFVFLKYCILSAMFIMHTPFFCCLVISNQSVSWLPSRLGNMSTNSCNAVFLLSQYKQPILQILICLRLKKIPLYNSINSLVNFLTNS